MNSDPRLRQEVRDQHEEHTTAEHQLEKVASREFSSAEELLRHDQNSVTVPPTLVERLAASVSAQGLKPTPWWRRWL